jgi:hypothetical protein
VFHVQVEWHLCPFSVSIRVAVIGNHS